MTEMPLEAPETRAERVRAARALMSANHYLTLATADEGGRPWASTVWFCAVFREASSTQLAVDFVWLSRPEAQHSTNLQLRAGVGISIFDSSQPADSGVGLQFAARAECVPAEEVDEAIAVFSMASVAAGGSAWSRAQVEGAAPLRVYRARPHCAFLLGDGSRVELPLG